MPIRALYDDAKYRTELVECYGAPLVPVERIRLIHPT